jgi:hypothetical protein
VSPGRIAELHRSVSTFVALQAGLAGIACWIWLCVLVFRQLPVSGWHVLAAAAAITFTLTAVVLAARSVNDRAAADRHEIAMRAVVELSWETFTAAMRPAPERPVSVREDDGVAEVIPLSQDQRPRRSR